MKWLDLNFLHLFNFFLNQNQKGLGKTIEMISLIHQNPKEIVDKESNQTPLKVSKATLVICPMSLLGQWTSELHSSMKKDRLKILTY